MEWLKHCSTDYLREGLSVILVDNEMDLPWPCPEATLCQGDTRSKAISGGE